MTRNLLNKSTRILLRYAILVVLVSAPVLYFGTRWLYLIETDETLSNHKKEFQQDRPRFRIAEIPIWNAENRDVQLLPADGRTRDTLYSVTYYDEMEQEAEPYRELRGPITIEGRPFTYLERTNLIEQGELILGVTALFLLVILVLFAGILLLTRRITRKLWQPFYATLQEMEQYELDKSLRPIFVPTGIVEFDRLNASVNHLIQRNEAIFSAQREFIENAAHELQTPLALFQGRIENLYQTQGLSQEQSELLDALNTDVGRLHRLNKNLLLLSRLDQDRNAEKQRLDLSECVGQNLAFFTEQAKSRNVTIVVEAAAKTFVQANPALLEVLVNNLFLNAIRHNRPGGEIIITLHATQLVFANTGGDSGLNPEKVFARFAKSDPSSPGNGLGLAIVRKVAELHGWVLRYDFEGNRHRFIVDFS